jgi:hypothetical protein
MAPWLDTFDAREVGEERTLGSVDDFSPYSLAALFRAGVTIQALEAFVEINARPKPGTIRAMSPPATMEQTAIEMSRFAQALRVWDVGAA